ncbi:MAG: cupredoxin domain-containing protein [Cyanobacteria bacterium]|nr:cupredoxin domain-containing protein [Cyanobacteriota bacterium]
MTSFLAAAVSNGEPLWRTIQQPLALRLAVAASEGERGLQEITITVDGGYSPARIRLKAGRPVRLTIHRLDPSSCVAQVIVPDFRRSVDLPLNGRTSLELPPMQPGEYPFHCGMAMVRGGWRWCELRGP